MVYSFTDALAVIVKAMNRRRAININFTIGLSVTGSVQVLAWASAIPLGFPPPVDLAH